jgi:hypothetical protein
MAAKPIFRSDWQIVTKAAPFSLKILIKQVPTKFIFQILIPNPDKTVVAKRKSRFIGELTILD